MMQVLIMGHIIGLLAVIVWMVCVFLREWNELYSRKNK